MSRKILCVCAMNGARSPMMAAILRGKLKLHGVTDVSVESAGTLEGARGQHMAEYAKQELRRRGIEPGDHKGRFIGDIGDLACFERIVCAGAQEAEEVRAMCSRAIWDRIQVANADSGGIPGVWEKGPEAYRVCADVIQEAMTSVALSL